MNTFLTLLLDANYHSVLKAIEKNTHFSWMPGILAFIISVIALIAAISSAWYTWKTYTYQKQTEENTSRLSMPEQRRLLADMIRHLYRNMVVSYSVKVKMKEFSLRAYPSEEHLTKMKTNLNDIHLNLFYRNDAEHRMMNKLYMELRNYNYEIDVICQHFKDPTIDDKTKERDLDTLCFKCNYLTESIVKVLGFIWEHKEEGFLEEARGIIKEVTKEKNGRGDIPYAKPFEPYRNPESFYVKTIFANNSDEFYQGFDENVRHECGMNEEGADKIHMIEFNKLKPNNCLTQDAKGTDAKETGD